MKYAVIAIAGSQYQVEEGQTITIDKLNPEITITDKVLLYVNEKDVKIGNPTVENTSVEFKILKNYQGDKIKIFKYKSKSRYRRHYGFRPQLVDIQITKINNSKEKDVKTAKVKTVKPKVVAKKTKV